MRLTLALLTLLASTTLAAETPFTLKKGAPLSILLDPAAPKSVRAAAVELQTVLAQSTGVAARLSTDPAAPAGELSISLGDTPSARGRHLALPPGEADSFRLVTAPGALFILGHDTADGAVNDLGGTAQGTANGVYAFLHDYLGVRWLTPDPRDTFIPTYDEFALPALDRTETPLFLYRVLPDTGSPETVATWERHLRLAKVAAPKHSHAWAETIPATLFAQHPDWFALVGGQRVPPTGRYKLETTNPALVRAYADAIIEVFRRDPARRWYSLSPADGSGGWSESPETQALLETDPHGAVSRTRLILSFYNEVARLVRAEFPDRHLGGYIYASYLYPPKDGLPRLEPNLSLVLAASIAYGYQLYRPGVQQEWENLVRAWGESARRDHFDLYYYDLPTSLKGADRLLLPDAPDLLNFIYPRLADLGFKGVYLSGRRDWIGNGAGNVAKARLAWDPRADAIGLVREWRLLAYGPAAAPHIEKIDTLLGEKYRAFYQQHPKANYNVTDDHLREIYRPLYPALAAEFHEAQSAFDQAASATNTTKSTVSPDPVRAEQQRRLRDFGGLLESTRARMTAKAGPAEE